MFFDIFSNLCKEKGISKTRAAAEIGLSNSITTKWKKTGATPGGDTLEKVADYFGVSIEHLLGGSEKETPPGKLEPTERERRILEALRAKTPAEQKALLTLLGISED